MYPTSILEDPYLQYRPERNRLQNDDNKAV